MQLVINTYGSFIKKKQNCFVIKNNNEVFEIAAKKVNSILITTSATLSSNAVKLAVENNIDIIFLNKYGDPFGRIWHCKMGSTTLIRRKQLQAESSVIGFNLVKKWISEKITNQISYLKNLKKNRSNSNDLFDPIIEQMTQLNDNLQKLTGDLETRRFTILGIEGKVSELYFNLLNQLLPEKWAFQGRSRNPAKDGFNCLLNYGYGILYSLIERSCIIAGLDPYIGFLHTDNYNKKSFVFDLIELYRVYVDRTVMNLFAKKKVNNELFDVIPGGYILNKSGKAILITELNEILDKETDYNNRQVKLRNVIQLKCHSIANKLIRTEMN